MSLKQRFFRVGRVLVTVIIGLLIVGAAYQHLAERRDLRQSPAPGALVDARGTGLHLYCVGDGSPTVIIEAGLNDFSVGWRDVQLEVAERTRTCTYDRAGSGWSDDDGEVPLPAHVVGNLRAALDNAQIPPPYLLVGHSWGGIVVREFAAQFPDLVAGMVLVDSSHESQNRDRPDEADELSIGFLRYCHAASFVGITRALQLRGEPWFDYPDIRAMSLYRTHSCAATLRSRYAAGLSMARIDAPRDLGALPLRVLTRGVADNPMELSPEERAWEDTWLSLQTELASLSTNSRHLVVAGASHFIHWDKPEVIIAAIDELLAL